MKSRNFLLMVFCICLFTLNASAQDSLSLKKNLIYINILGFSSDVLELNDYWFSIGYDRKIDNKLILGLNAGTIVLSKPSTGVFYGAGFNTDKSTGIRLNLELKYLLKKTFYTSANLFFQNTKTFCKENILDYSNSPSMITINEYSVNRHAYSFIPKIGCILKKKTSSFYTDLNIGLGIKYIDSKVADKTGALSNAKESYSGKFFEHGSIITYHPLFHIKLGCNF